MISIKKVGFGNFTEAYIEERFINGVNIIYSNENNKGKTLVLQSLMYALGNEPIFPINFPINDYYYYCELEKDGEVYKFLRKHNTFLVQHLTSIWTYTSISDFKNIFFTNQIYTLPCYFKDKELKRTELLVFFQLFFLAQDKRDTSNIQNHSFFNKIDFELMINSLIKPSEEIQGKKNSIKELKSQKLNITKEIQKLEKKDKFITDYRDISSSVFSSIDEEEANKVKIELDTLNNKIAKMSNSYRREQSRISKLGVLLNELNSLNTAITEGTVRCADCGSERIVYEAKDLIFDLTNDCVRKQIKESIKQQIKEKEILLTDVRSELSTLENEYKELLLDKPKSLTDFILFKEEIRKSNKNVQELQELLKQNTEIENQIGRLEANCTLEDKQIKDGNESLLAKIKEYYLLLDSNNTLFPDSLFTRKNENYSGSDGQIYYFSRLMAFRECFDLPFPIIIDGFRDGEISSDKEEKMINAFLQQKNQVILSATLKKEEYNNAYEKFTNVNKIDYSSMADKKILCNEFVSEFQRILESFGITKK